MILFEQAIGSEGKMIAELKKGKLTINVYHDHKSGVLSFAVEQDAAYFLDKLAAAVPGALDDVVIAMVKDAVAKLD